MVQQLAKMGYISYKKYGYIMLEENGKKIGTWLIRRHMIIEDFLRIIGVKDTMVLQETEKIEHMLSNDTALCMESLVAFLLENPDMIDRYKEYRANRV
jgi:Mn-dependent DtxR family transcriptional regulator